jgi:hypothetical protein
MALSIEGSNKRILGAAPLFFLLLIVLLTPNGCLSYEPLDSPLAPVSAAP